ncbi:MAG: XrtB/PEP-CTERM-associated polysaccharide biosynthesis outer membrane protein EpsL [Burkholderiales bacterium]
MAQTALAEQDRAIMLLVGSSATWNSNIFLTPSNARSVYYAAPYVGLRLDKLYAQQEFQAHVTETFYRYSISALNSNSFEYGGAWLWHLSPRVNGTISADRNQSVNNFSNFQGNGAQNFVVTTENRNFTLDNSLFGGWHLLAGASDFRSTNSQPFTVLGDYRLYGFSDTGVRYVTQSGNSISAVNRWSQGSYLNQAADPVTVLDNAFQEQENGLRSTWNLGGKSSVNTRLSWLARRYQNFAQRNYSGPTGEIVFYWAPLSSKLGFNLAYRRDLAAFLTDQSSFTVTNTFSFAPSWQVSPKIALRMNLAHAKLAYRGPVVGPPFPLRGDTVLSALLAADWTPLRNVSLSASVQRSRRTSNISAFEYNNTIGFINASLKF